jgi:hypothetical protein
VTDSTISDVIAKLMTKKPTHDPVEQPINRSDLIPRETRWTNQIQIEKATSDIVESVTTATKMHFV